MSFFSNFQTDKCPGPINGNPVSGLNEKVCLQAQRVFDACIKQGQSDGIVLNLTDPVPAAPTYPLTFISARSMTSAGTVTAFQVDRLPDPAGCARGQATDIQIQAEQILRVKRTMNEILAANTGKPLDVIERDTDRDNYMTAEQALEYGLVDKIIAKRP